MSNWGGNNPYEGVIHQTKATDAQLYLFHRFARPLYLI